MNIRAIAAKILAQVLGREKSLSELLPYSGAELSTKDQALLQALCFGVCRWQIRLDTINKKLLSKPLKAKDADIQALLLLGLFQILYTRIPAHAAVSETVNACAVLKKSWARGLMNAVLRRFQREQESLLGELASDNTFKYSHPKWLLARLQQAWPEHWPEICEANNLQAPMFLRVNQQQSSREDYLNLLANADIEAQACCWSDQGILLAQACDVSQLPDFPQGKASVQDEAAQLASGLLELAPGMRVLDACAAPGGKTCHILETEPALEQVVALEMDKNRLQRITENLSRLNLQANIIQGDATKPGDWWDGKFFDRILLDAPCSATGVIRRHPDIKLLRRNTDIDKLAMQQLKMLNALWPLLKPGGILVYATCSILPQEDDQVIGQFVGTAANAELLPISADWGKIGETGRYLLPDKEGNDGFYYARIRKD